MTLNRGVLLQKESGCIAFMEQVLSRRAAYPATAACRFCSDAFSTDILLTPARKMLTVELELSTSGDAVSVALPYTLKLLNDADGTLQHHKLFKAGYLAWKAP